jgi:hypothetical protein
MRLGSSLHYRVLLLLCATGLTLAQAPVRSSPPTATAAAATSGLTLTQLYDQFTKPPDDARIMMRWWWFGPAVSNQELEREMRVMKESGIGGFEVQAVYPLTLDGPDIQNHPYLSPEFLDSLRFAAVTAKSLGLRMDVTLGSGWPYGGPHIPVDHAAGKLRIEHVKVTAGATSVSAPTLAAGESLIAAFDAQGKEIPSSGNKGGQLSLPAAKAVAADASSEVTFFIASRTRQQVKRAAVGAEGPVMDHYDRAALDLHLKTVGEKLLGATGANIPYAVFCDSLEVYASDWTNDFLAEFQKRRGYDLRPYLPKLARAAAGLSASSDDSAAVRGDWGRTLTDLLNEHFFTPLRAWAKEHGAKLRAQAYGMPPASISTAAQIDLPEGEGVQWKTLSQLRYATSMAHVFGHPVASSETWTWLHSPVFRATPLDMKAEADVHFLQGVNQLVGHGYPYTAPGVEYPGWRFYASAAFGEKNPWWIAMPEVAAYLQRVSFMLRQGKPVNDVALYMPNHDAWSRFTPGRVDLRATLAETIGPDVIPTIMETGYNFDVVDDGVLESAKIENRAFHSGDGTYPVVVLPGVERIPLGTMRKLDEFVRNGGQLIATRRLPDKVPGLKATAADNEALHKLVTKLFEGQEPPAYFVHDDRHELSDRLWHRYQRDVLMPPDMPEIGFVHRRADLPSGPGEIYFVANTGNQIRAVPAQYRSSRSRVEIWNPLSGESKPGQVISVDKGMSTVILTLEPYGSRFLIFSREPESPARGSAAAFRGDMDLSADWKVRFEGHGGQPSQQTFAALHSWTDDAATSNFSGVAIYEKQVELPADWVQQGVGAVVQFGEGKAVAKTPGMGFQAMYEGPVREAAVVYVNGKRAGSAWCPPYAVDVSGLLQAGKNTIEIRVGNLAVNYMAGQKLPDYQALNARYGERFQAQDMDKIKPVPAGLLGPIHLASTVRR